MALAVIILAGLVPLEAEAVADTAQATLEQVEVALTVRKAVTAIPAAAVEVAVSQALALGL